MYRVRFPECASTTISTLGSHSSHHPLSLVTGLFVSISLPPASLHTATWETEELCCVLHEPQLTCLSQRQTETYISTTLKIIAIQRSQLSFSFQIPNEQNQIHLSVTMHEYNPGSWAQGSTSDTFQMSVESEHIIVRESAS